MKRSPLAAIALLLGLLITLILPATVSFADDSGEDLEVTQVTPLIEVGPEVTPNGIYISGVVNRPGTANPAALTPVDGLTLHVSIDGKPMTDTTSGRDGGFQLQIRMSPDDKEHTVTVSSDASEEFTAASYSVKVLLEKPYTTVLDAKLENSSVESGFSVKITGSLKASNGKAIAGQEIMVDMGSSKEVAAVRTENDGSFALNAPAPKTESETQVAVRVYFVGEADFPPAETSLNLTVKPAQITVEETEEASVETSTTVETVAPQTVAPKPQQSEGNSLLWPIIITLVVLLAVVGGIVAMAMKHKNAQDSAVDSLDSVPHGGMWNQPEGYTDQTRMMDSDYYANQYPAGDEATQEYRPEQYQDMLETQMFRPMDEVPESEAETQLMSPLDSQFEEPNPDPAPGLGEQNQDLPDPDLDPEDPRNF